MPQEFNACSGRIKLSEKEIVEVVGRYLKDKHPGGVTLEALPQGVRHEQDWWYVNVRSSSHLLGAMNTMKPYRTQKQN